MSETIDLWRKEWRDSLSKVFALDELQLLERALETKDPSLIQGETVNPTYSKMDKSKTPTGACLIGFVGWKSGLCDTVSDVQMYFDEITGDTQNDSDEFITWYDTMPSDEMRRQLLSEIKRSLALLTDQEVEVHHQELIGV